MNERTCERDAVLLAAAQLMNQSSFLWQIEYSNQIIDLTTDLGVRHVVETTEIGQMLLDGEVKDQCRLTVEKKERKMSSEIIPHKNCLEQE